MTDRATENRAYFAARAEGWHKMGSPLMSRIARLMSERLSNATQAGDAALNWPGPEEDAVLLRLTGGLHRLVLEGRAPGLAAAYADPDTSDDALWEAIDFAMRRFDHQLLTDLDSPPQTNEVRRSAVLIAAGHWLAARYDRPMILSELGASAGLNTLWDRYALKIGDQTFGPAKPALTLTPDWTGPLPPTTAPRIIEREGVDRQPLDPKTDQLRILSYIWADQHDRLQRTRTAARLAAKAKPKITQGDAVDWLELRLATHYPGWLHLVQHTIVAQYFSDEQRGRMNQLFEAAGSQATQDAPLAHLAMETDQANPKQAAITLRLWPEGATIKLGTADYHGRWIDWAGIEPDAVF